MPAFKPAWLMHKYHPVQRGPVVGEKQPQSPSRAPDVFIRVSCQPQSNDGEVVLTGRLIVSRWALSLGGYIFIHLTVFHQKHLKGAADQQFISWTYIYIPTVINNTFILNISHEQNIKGFKGRDKTFCAKHDLTLDTKIVYVTVCVPIITVILYPNTDVFIILQLTSTQKWWLNLSSI